jgi:integrase
MRLRGRIERILARATVEGLRKGDNPARWDGHLSEAGLPKRSKIQPVIHHAAMHYSDVPAFMRELAERDEVSADALSFLILTCARTGEVMGAAWPEVDWSQALWTVPAERAKSNRDHAVPLSTAGLAVLRKMQASAACTGDRSEFIFPGRYGGGLSQMTMLALLQRRMGRDLTVHGFRSAFRDWCGDVAGIERDLAEAALAHVVRDRTEAAYRRQTAIERRRAVMQQWADYCIPSSRENVVDMVAAARRAQTSG